MGIIEKIKQGVEKSNSGDRLKNKPRWVFRIENRIARAIPLHPNMISALKLAVIVPLLILALKQLGTLPSLQGVVVTLFVSFCVLDYLDGTVARYKGQATFFGSILDQLTDFPVLLILSVFCLEILPVALLAAKVILDLVLILLFVTGSGKSEGRFRVGLNYVTLFALLIVSQGWASKLITPDVVSYLLGINIFFAAIIVLFNLNLLQKRFIADALSGVNLMCGIFSIYFASRGRNDICLMFLMLGAAFDGFDGAAARKFGSTRMGVYSDDIADGVNYGIAPACALYFTVGGAEGLAVAIAYAVFTVGRLVYFTLNKANSDPNFFSGVPSPMGGLMTICALILFEDLPVLLGLMVGIACIQMLSFDTLYRHLGRALSANRRIVYGMPLFLFLLIGGHFFIDKIFPVALLLLAAMIYGFFPTIVHFREVTGKKNKK